MDPIGGTIDRIKLPRSDVLSTPREHRPVSFRPFVPAEKRHDRGDRDAGLRLVMQPRAIASGACCVLEAVSGRRVEVPSR
jgi:hypothetical protein